MRYQRRGDGSVCLNSFFFIGPYSSQWQTTLIRLLSFMFVVMGWPAMGQALPGLVLSETAVTVTEGGTQTYTVKLATEPSADVTVQVRSQGEDTGAATVSPLHLTFTTEDWNTAQTVTVSGVEDPDTANETVTLAHRASGGDYDTISGTVTVSVTDNAGFSLSCGDTVAEGDTLTCTLSNPGTSAVSWPGVAIFHLSDDTDRALVRGGDSDVEFDTLTPTATVEEGVWWVGQVLVAYQHFDWSGEAAANASRSIAVMALDDELYEGDEQFYITLTLDGSRNRTALYYDTHKQTITLTDNDTAGTDTSLASLDVRAPGAETALSTPLSGTSYAASVDYEVSEVVLTPTATHPAATIVVGSDAEEVESGGTSRIFQLAAGATSSIPVTVTAEDGVSTRTYTLALTRASRPPTVTVQTDSFSLECPALGREGASLSCTLTNTGSSSAAFPVVALIHSSLDSDPATVAEDSILPASHPSYQDDVGFPDTVRTSDAYAYTYGYGELFSGGSREYVTYGYEKFSKTEAVDAGATRTISIVLHGDTVEEDPERFYLGLAPADYTGLKKLIANKAPISLLPNRPPTFSGTTPDLSVAEDTEVGTDIGAPVTATDPDTGDGAILTYSLRREDTAFFGIDPNSGQLRTQATLDHEATPSHMVVVTVTDSSKATAAITVTITVTDVNEPPEFTSGPTFTAAENQTAAGTVQATDPEDDTLTWSLAGADADDFTIPAGVLTFRATPDYETPADTDLDNVYNVTVRVSDGKDADGNTDTTVDATIAVTVTVTNEDEMGTVTLFPAQSQVGSALRATLSDPDGVPPPVTSDGNFRSVVRWQWFRSSDGNNWREITDFGTDRAADGTLSARRPGPSYTPTASDQGKYLKAKASYIDRQGDTGDNNSSEDRTVEVVSVHKVEERESAPEISVVELVSDLTIPWDIAFTPDGTMLFTERKGKLYSRLSDGTVQTVTADFDDLHHNNEAGLMAIVVDPAFADNSRFYTCQAHTGPEVQVIAWTFNDDTYTAATRAADPLVGNIPAASRHSGCRLRFGPQGYLWIATGDATVGTAPQDLNSLGGKVLRVDAATGAAAAGNPFGSRIYTYGHRNVQGLARRPGTDQMWSVEHGPRLDDEINLLSAGGNYGWDPVPGYDEGVPMTDLAKFSGAVEARWSSGNPTLATSGAIFLEGEDWGEWDGRLAVATLKTQSLRVFDFTDDGALESSAVVPELNETYGRLRTPMMGPDGALYVTTSNGNGEDKILKVVPSAVPMFSTTETNSPGVVENSRPSTVVTTVTATDDDTLTYTLSGPDAEAFAINSDGEITVSEGTVLDHETKESYEVIVTATDRYGLSDSITLTIDVTDVNEPPEAGNDEFVLDEDTEPALDVLDNDTDPEGKETLGISSVTRPSHGTADVAANRIIYTPALDYHGSDSFTYTVTDGPHSDTATVSLTITAVNDAPTFSAPSLTLTVDENDSDIGQVTATDVDDRDLTYGLTGDDAGFFAIDDSGQLRTTIALNYEEPQDQDGNNSYEFSVTVQDDEGATDTLPVLLLVTDVDEAGSITLPPRPLVNVPFTATLNEPDQLTGVITWQWARSGDRNTRTDIDGATAATYTPGANDQGYYLQVRVSYEDVHGEQGPLTAVSSPVEKARETNESPVFEDGAPTTRRVEENTAVGQPIGDPVTATDPDDRVSDLRYALDPAGAVVFAIDEQTGQLRTKAALDYETQRSYTRHRPGHGHPTRSGRPTPSP